MSFHVPEQYRVLRGAVATTRRDGNNGRFQIPAVIPGREIRVIASDGAGWEHVSVSIEGRKRAVPNWEEMCRVKDLFWDDDDVVIQFHPKKADYVNNHLGCLHMWRPIGVKLPTPHPAMVGLRGVDAAQMQEMVKKGIDPRADEAESDRIERESLAALAPFKTQQ